MAPTNVGDLEQAVRADPENAALRHLLAAGYAEAGQPERAKAEFFHAITLDPKAYVARFQLGLLLLTTGDETAALRVWEPLESLPQEDALLHFKRGLESLVRGDRPLCRTELARGIASNSANAPLNEDMRRILAAAGDAAEPVRTDFSLYGTTRQ